MSGISRERQVQDRLEDEDWVVTRAAGSLGFYDLHASKHGHLTRLIEVKATHRGPYHGFGPADRANLKAVAARAGALAQLAWWPPRGKLRFIDSSKWPDPLRSRARIGKEWKEGPTFDPDLEQRYP